MTADCKNKILTLEEIAVGLAKSFLALKSKDRPSIVGIYGCEESQLVLVKERMEVYFSKFSEEGQTFSVVLGKEGHHIDVGYFIGGNSTPDLTYDFSINLLRRPVFRG